MGNLGENLAKAIYKNYLAIRCPSCNHCEWSVSSSLSGEKNFDCFNCTKQSPVFSWVTFIKRIGDGDAFVNFTIKKEREGYLLCVDTSERNTSETESIRFCEESTGGQSLAVLTLLRSITKEKNRLVMEGEGGRLLVYQGKGDNDVWMMKTENDGEGTFHGAKVLFTKDHEFTGHIVELIQAMLTDMESRPTVRSRQRVTRTG